VCGLQTLGTFLDFELDLLSLGQGVEAFTLDRGVMNENVLLTFTRDKAIPLAIVEPLDGSCNPFGHVKHSFILVLWKAKQCERNKKDCPVSAVTGSLVYYGQNSLRLTERDYTTDVKKSQIGLTARFVVVVRVAC
jgi:hypothetical protein